MTSQRLETRLGPSNLDFASFMSHNFFWPAEGASMLRYIDQTTGMMALGRLTDSRLTDCTNDRLPFDLLPFDPVTI